MTISNSARINLLSHQATAVLTADTVVENLDNETYRAIRLANEIAASMDGTIGYAKAFGTSHIVVDLPAAPSDLDITCRPAWPPKLTRVLSQPLSTYAPADHRTARSQNRSSRVDERRYDRSMHKDIIQAIDEDRTRIVSELEAMVAIPSVSAPDFPADEVRRSAQFVANLMNSSGMTDVRLLEVDGAHPAVYGIKKGPKDAPTILLYAHHDVQPPGPAEQWDNDPFEPETRDGRMIGRGAADDKAGIALHLASIRALRDDVPVTIKMFVEGEEEIGSLHLEGFLNEYTELLSSDAIIIGDAGNWRIGEPTLTTSLRGLVDCTVTVRTLKYAVHSGSFGGLYPDANMVLARVITSLHHADGSVAVEGIHETESDPLDLTVEEIDSQTLPVEGLHLLGHGTLTARTWTQPSISVLAIDSVPIPEAINQIVPEASAIISMRVPPGQDSDEAFALLVAHLENAVPWGAEITVTPGVNGSAINLETTGAMYTAYRTGMEIGYGRPPIEAGMGGSIPFVDAFSNIYPDAAVLLVGVGDPTSRIHGPNESVELADVSKAAVAQAIALRALVE